MGICTLPAILIMASIGITGQNKAIILSFIMLALVFGKQKNTS